jgi:2-oxoglutarate dehydrogenase E2 component (dihydrolipoamide succinyltransferase)
MAHFDIIMPKMGESIEEATITKWFVKEGDKVAEDDVLLEIATDKVDSEIPSPVEGVVKKILFEQDETVAVGTVIAVIDMEGGDTGDSSDKEQAEESKDVLAKDSAMMKMENNPDDEEKIDKDPDDEEKIDKQPDDEEKIDKDSANDKKKEKDSADEEEDSG